MSREAFLKARIRKIEVSGDTFHVRALTGAQLEELIGQEGDERLDGIRAISRVCMYCVCDESGKRLFSEADLDSVRDADVEILKAVADAALDLSGLGEASGN